MKATLSSQIKESLRMQLKFWVYKALPATLAIAGCVCYFQNRFIVGIDDQKTPCLRHHVYLVDKTDRRLETGKAYAFRVAVRPLSDSSSKRRTPDLHIQVSGAKNSVKLWAKRLVAKAGDTVEVTADGLVMVNGSVVREGLSLAKLMNKAPEDFAFKKTLSPNELFFVGDTATSYDSRYWGTISPAHVVGKVLFI